MCYWMINSDGYFTTAKWQTFYKGNFGDKFCLPAIFVIQLVVERICYSYIHLWDKTNCIESSHRHSFSNMLVNKYFRMTQIRAKLSFLYSLSTLAFLRCHSNSFQSKPKRKMLKSTAQWQNEATQTKLPGIVLNYCV